MPTSGKFDVSNKIKKYLTQLEKVLLCQICKNILNEPISLFCRHEFCLNCIPKLSNLKCPVCKTKFNRQDFKIRKDISDLCNIINTNLNKTISISVKNEDTNTTKETIINSLKKQETLSPVSLEDFSCGLSSDSNKNENTLISPPFKDITNLSNENKLKENKLPITTLNENELAQNLISNKMDNKHTLIKSSKFGRFSIYKKMKASHMSHLKRKRPKKFSFQKQSNKLNCENLSDITNCCVLLTDIRTIDSPIKPIDDLPPAKENVIENECTTNTDKHSLLSDKSQCEQIEPELAHHTCNLPKYSLKKYYGSLKSSGALINANYKINNLYGKIWQIEKNQKLILSELTALKHLLGANQTVTFVNMNKDTSIRSQIVDYPDSQQELNNSMGVLTPPTSNKSMMIGEHDNKQNSCDDFRTRNTSHEIDQPQNYPILMSLLTSPKNKSPQLQNGGESSPTIISCTPLIEENNFNKYNEISNRNKTNEASELLLEHQEDLDETHCNLEANNNKNNNSNMNNSKKRCQEPVTTGSPLTDSIRDSELRNLTGSTLMSRHNSSSDVVPLIATSTQLMHEGHTHQNMSQAFCTPAMDTMISQQTNCDSISFMPRFSSGTSDLRVTQVDLVDESPPPPPFKETGRDITTVSSSRNIEFKGDGKISLEFDCGNVSPSFNTEDPFDPPPKTYAKNIEKNRSVPSPAKTNKRANTNTTMMLNEKNISSVKRSKSHDIKEKTQDVQKEENATNIVLTTSGLGPLEMEYIRNFINTFDGVYMPKYSPQITHIIVKSDEDGKCERTLKYFQGIAGKKWICSFRWLQDSINKKHLLPQDPYEVLGDTLTEDVTFAPKLSRLSYVNDKGVKDHQTLLSAFAVCVYGSFAPDLPAAELRNLLIMCGAQIIESPSKFTVKKCSTGLRKPVPVIISQTEANDPPIPLGKYNDLYEKYGAFPVAREWVFDSIALYGVVPLIHYLQCQSKVLTSQDKKFISNVDYLL